MRIIGGRHRGRTLRLPAGVSLRPTADRVRQAVFNVLEHGVDWPGVAGASVLDLFAGTGAYGIEALSRGAGHATFVDSHPAAVAGIRATLVTLGDMDRARVHRLDAARLPERPAGAIPPATLAFLDPPYRSGLALPALNSLLPRGWVVPGAIAVVETATGEPFSLPGNAVTVDERTYGAARVAFLRLE